MRIDSRDFASLKGAGGGTIYCWAIVKNGRITELHDERWREGGQLWGRSFSANGTLKNCVMRLGREFGAEWYKAVRKAAYKDKLPTARRMLDDKREREIAWAKEEMERTRKEYLQAKKAYEKAKAR